MKTRFCIFAVSMLTAVSAAQAGFSCGGVLDSNQEEGFKTFFDPDFSPSLKHAGGTVSPANMYKYMKQSKFDEILNKPKAISEATLSDGDAGTLKSWLNDNAGKTVPGWFSIALSPTGWVGLAIDILIQIAEADGDAGRIDAANIAGTVSGGGKVAVVTSTGKDRDGKPKFLWILIYNAKLNGKSITFPMRSCNADVKFE